ncbi:hypothetical protein IT575_13600 [bacterium]|nr:hypothetical protein [bacterium]
MRVYGALISALAAALCGLLCLPAQALTTSEGQDQEARRRESQQASDLAAAETLKLLDMQSTLQARPRESWTAAELLAYQQQAILCIDLGLRAMIISDMDLPYMIGPEDGGWLCQWPANPYDIDATGQWRPIRVLDLNDPFEPGALVWQSCPAEAYSLVDDWLRARSFEVSLYGASAETEVDAAVAPQPGNSWARVPPGTAVLRGLHTPPGPELPAETKYPRQDILDFPARDAWARSAARDWYQQYFAGQEHGPNFRLNWFVHGLGTSLSAERRYRDYRAVLEARASTDWSEQELLDCQQWAGWLVYSALTNVMHSGLGERIRSREDLLAMHLLPAWPDNPLKGWQPMRWLELQDGFSAGDFVFQNAPLEFNYRISQPFGHNFVLSVYGPREDYSPENLSPVSENQQDWALSPAGSAGNWSAYSSEPLQLAFNRAMRSPDQQDPQNQYADGRPRRLARSAASYVFQGSAEQLAQAAEAERERLLLEYQRSLLQGLYECIELYKYEQGVLPADLSALGGSDYLDAWPGDPLAALAALEGSSIYLPASWPAIRVLGPGEAPQPGCLLWEPGVAGDAKWVQDSLAGPFANPALAYRLSLYGSDPAAGPLYTVQGSAETFPQSRCRRLGTSLLDYEVGQTRYNSERRFWPAGFSPEELKAAALKAAEEARQAETISALP